MSIIIRLILAIIVPILLIYFLIENLDEDQWGYKIVDWFDNNEDFVKGVTLAGGGIPVYVVYFLGDKFLQDKIWSRKVDEFMKPIGFKLGCSIKRAVLTNTVLRKVLSGKALWRLNNIGDELLICNNPHQS